MQNKCKKIQTLEYPAAGNAYGSRFYMPQYIKRCTGCHEEWIPYSKKEKHTTNKNGKKVKGWLTLNGKKYYFSKSTGVQAKGWVKDKKGRKRYFTSKAGVMVTGWLSNSKGQRRYFAPSTGYMKTKWLKLGGKTYYLYAKSGVAATVL